MENTTGTNNGTNDSTTTCISKLLLPDSVTVPGNSITNVAIVTNNGTGGSCGTGNSAIVVSKNSIKRVLKEKRRQDKKVLKKLQRKEERKLKAIQHQQGSVDCDLLEKQQQQQCEQSNKDNNDTGSTTTNDNITKTTGSISRHKIRKQLLWDIEKQLYINTSFTIVLDCNWLCIDDIISITNEFSIHANNNNNEVPSSSTNVQQVQHQQQQQSDSTDNCDNDTIIQNTNILLHQQQEQQNNNHHKMTIKEIKSLVNQIRFIYSSNKEHIHPVQIVITNIQSNTIIEQYLQIQTGYTTWYTRGCICTSLSFEQYILLSYTNNVKCNDPTISDGTTATTTTPVLVSSSVSTSSFLSEAHSLQTIQNDENYACNTNNNNTTPNTTYTSETNDSDTDNYIGIGNGVDVVDTTATIINNINKSKSCCINDRLKTIDTTKPIHIIYLTSDADDVLGGESNSNTNSNRSSNKNDNDSYDTTMMMKKDSYMNNENNNNNNNNNTNIFYVIGGIVDRNRFPQAAYHRALYLQKFFNVTNNNNNDTVSINTTVTTKTTGTAPTDNPTATATTILPTSISSPHFCNSSTTMNSNNATTTMNATNPNSEQTTSETTTTTTLSSTQTTANTTTITITTTTKTNVIVQMMKLPLKQYIESMPSTPILTCLHVVNLLLHYKTYNDWKLAFQTILPIRKGATYY